MTLPLFMTLFAFIGVAVTSATVAVFGSPVADPIELVGRLGGGWPIVIGLFGVALATLSTNLAANVVSPANAAVHLSPRVFDFRRAALLAAGLGAIILPWKLIESTAGYIFTWLVGYSALLGPVGGILIADYYLLRRRELDVDALYSWEGEFAYRRGVNPAAMWALALGVAPNLPGFLEAAGLVGAVPALFSVLYTYAWFVGFGLSAIVYLVLMTIGRRRAAVSSRLGDGSEEQEVFAGGDHDAAGALEGDGEQGRLIDPELGVDRDDDLTGGGGDVEHSAVHRPFVGSSRVEHPELILTLGRVVPREPAEGHVALLGSVAPHDLAGHIAAQRMVGR